MKRNKINLRRLNLELKATMYNINYGHNQKLMEQCRTLAEYAYFISRIRYYETERSYSIEKAVDSACVECINKGILRYFLLKNRSEVVDMFMIDYNPRLLRRMDWEEGFNEGKTAGFSEGKTAGFSEGKTAGFSEGKTAGFSEGKTAGFSEGETKGSIETQKLIVKNMLSRNMAVEEIIELTGCSVDLIHELQK